MMSFLLFNTLLAQSLTIDNPNSGVTRVADQYQFFSMRVNVSGGVNPYEISASNLPNGLIVDLDDDGNGARILGAASVTGTFNVMVNVSDSNPGGAETESVSFDIQVDPLPANTIEINIPNVFELDNGTVGVQYPTIQFSTTDDSVESCYRWVIDSGSLPDGIVLSPGDGNLLGTPTESGEFNFVVVARDNSCPNNVKANGTRAYRLTIEGSTNTGDLQISSPTSANLPNGVLGNSYAVDIDASGGNGAYIFTASGLPGGLVIASSTGVITGTPSATGTFNVTVTVEDEDDDTASRSYTLTISETGDAEYGSSPSPGSTIDFGDVNIGSSYSVNLVVSEEGSDDLEVTQPSSGFITGSDSSNFAITSNTPPFTIDDGEGDVTVKIRCTPDREGDFNAVLRFATNDSNRSTVVYTLFCQGVTTGGNEDEDSDVVATPIVDSSTPTPSIPTQTPFPPTYANVIEVQGLSLRTGPFIGASRRAVLRPEIPYRVTAKNNQEGVYMWYYIITDDGLEGWASARYLAVYGQDVPFTGSIMDNVWNERDRGVRVQALDNLHFRPAPSDRTQPYVDLIPWGGIMRVFARTTSGRGDEWYAVQYNGINGWVYAPNTKVVEGLMEAISKF